MLSPPPPPSSSPLPQHTNNDIDHHFRHGKLLRDETRLRLIMSSIVLVATGIINLVGDVVVFVPANVFGAIQTGVALMHTTNERPHKHILFMLWTTLMQNLTVYDKGLFFFFKGAQEIWNSCVSLFLLRSVAF